jgi:hypothetical protein
MNKRELEILEEIKKDVKSILEKLNNPGGYLNNEKPKQNYIPNQPATERQIFRLKKEGIEVPNGLTKTAASKIIEDIEKIRNIPQDNKIPEEKFPDY